MFFRGSPMKNLCLIILFFVFFCGQPFFVLAAEKDAVIENTLDRAEEEVAPPAVLPDTEKLSPKKNSSLLDVVDFQETDIRDAIKILEQKSGYRIECAEEIFGRITITLRDIFLEDALRIILEPNHLAFVEEDGVIRVMLEGAFEMKFGRRFSDTKRSRIVSLKYITASEAAAKLSSIKSPSGKIFLTGQPQTLVLLDSPTMVQEMEAFLKRVDAPIVTEVFQVHYADAEEITNAIKGNLSKDIGQIRHDKNAKKIVVTDTSENVKEIADLIQKMDQKKEVHFATQVIQVVLSDEYKVGVDWEAIVSDYRALANPGIGAVKDRRQLSLGVVSPEDFLVLQDALETVGKTQTFTTQDISVENGEQLSLQVNPSSSQVLVTMKPEEMQAGLPAFYITPSVHVDDSLVIKVRPILSPVTTENELKIKENAIMVLGGIFHERQVKSTKKFPVLGDIPLLGFAFRRQKMRLLRTEYIIFLTPKIVSPSAGEGPATTP
jgi:type IV pilus assembly protein PilQ